ncbi:hypothetical protein ACGFYU_37675 [Streptomyces sp. NPDC048337]|uniref:hypothetical protein n=1 Tax=Streptomyces sp. NPDC048337 TaxID=3365535 RepID=UPI003712AAA8
MIDRDGYLNVRSHGAAVFDLDARLPVQVFKEDIGDSLFYDFDSVLVPEIWPALCAMARWHGDEYVELLVLKPDCDTYYVADYQTYPAISLSVEASEDDYWAALSHEPNDDIFGSLAISADVITVTGASGKWGCWGERDPEVAVFRGFPNVAAQNEWRKQFGPFLSVSDALDTYLDPVFRGKVPPEYAATLTANYGPSGGERP